MMLRRLAESRWAGPAGLALVSYLPLLLTRRGLVVADTKQYLYLDPGAAMSASSSLWDSLDACSNSKTESHSS